ncbi:glycosyltransferase [Anditalea andensis]|nr:glycosyltransferase [Anditalea andensis]
MNLLQDCFPDLVIVTTYELLPAAVWAKKRLGFKLIYDVQENYALNILDHNTLPFGMGYAYAKLVQLIEKRTAPYVDHFLLAEESYKDELPFIGKHTVLQNKFSGNINPVKPYRLDKVKIFHFVISGTLTPSYGSHEAMHWFAEILNRYPGSKLTIIGHVPLNTYKNKLEKIGSKNHAFKLHLSSTPIAHQEILRVLKSADIVLLPYLQKSSIKYKIPTKLYEALALGKPVLYTQNLYWDALVQRYPGGMPIDFSNKNSAIKAFESFLSLTLYNTPPTKELTWEHEKAQWKAIVDKLIQ